MSRLSGWRISSRLLVVSAMAGAAISATAIGGLGSARAGASPASIGSRAPSTGWPGTVTGVVDTAAGTPAAGACVRATPAGGPAFRAHRGLVPLSTETGRGGRFFLGGLAPGYYDLSFTSCSSSPAAALAGHIHVTALTPTRRVLVTGYGMQSLSTVRLAPVPELLGPGGRPTPSELFGRPVHAVPPLKSAAAGALSGVVTTKKGAGLKGMCVYVASFTGEYAGTTGAGGVFHITGIAPGGYQVEVTAGCGDSANWLGQLYNDGTDLPVRAGKTTTGVDVTMTMGGGFSGVISVPKSDGSDPVCLAATYETTTESFFLLAEVPANTPYSIPSLPPETYQLSFFNCSTANLATIWWKNARSLQQSQPLTVPAGRSVRDVSATLPVGGQIEGTVTGAGKGLPGTCAIATVDLTANLQLISTYPAGAGGAYDVNSLDTGRYTLDYDAACGSKGNYAPSASPSPITVEIGKVTSGADVSLGPGAAISGKVTDSAGKPLAGICVEYGSNVIPEGVPPPPPVTSAKGTYELRSLPTALYELYFTPCGLLPVNYVSEYYQGQVSGYQAKIFHLTAGQRRTGVDAVLPTGATLAGRVTDSSGHGVAGACVVLTPYGSGFVGNSPGILEASYGVQADSEGRFEVEGLPTDAYTVFTDPTCGGELVSKWAASYYGGGDLYPARRLVSLTEGMRTELEISLTEGGTISGRVRVPAGSGGAAGCLFLFTIGGQQVTESAPAFTPQGAYSVTGIMPGTYIAGLDPCGDSTAGPDYSGNVPTIGAASMFTVSPAKDSVVDFDLPTAAGIRGHVTEPAGSSTSVCVSVESTQDPVGALTAFDVVVPPATRYEISGLSAAKYAVLFEACGGPSGLSLSFSRPVTTVAGSTRYGVNGFIPYGGNVVTRVVSSSGAGLGGVCIGVGIPDRLGQTVFFTSQTFSASGDYDQPELPAGTYPVSVDVQCGIDGTWSVRKAPATVVVRARATTHLSSVVLDPGGTITGRVSVWGKASRADICVLAVETSPGMPAILATTEASGRYSISGLAAGTYDVEFTNGCGNPTIFETLWWRSSTTQAGATPVHVPSGGTATGIDPVLPDS